MSSNTLRFLELLLLDIKAWSIIKQHTGFWITAATIGLYIVCVSHCIAGEKWKVRMYSSIFNFTSFLLGYLFIFLLSEHKVSQSGKSIKPFRKQVVFENTTHCSYSTATCTLNPVTGKRGSPDSLCVTLSQIIGNARALTPTGLRRGIKYVNPQNR